ncbi:hypothetical protein P692DRAFT_20828471, partial [Suillus brevipes Sb2]
MNDPLDVHDAIHTIDCRLGLMRLPNDGSIHAYIHLLVSITVAIPGININGEKDTMHGFLIGQTDWRTMSNPATNASMMNRIIDSMGERINEIESFAIF